MFDPERDTIEELQRRREQVLTYLEQVVLPNDQVRQTAIDHLKKQVAEDRARLRLLVSHQSQER